MDRPNTATFENSAIDFDIHGGVRIRLIGPSPGDLCAACNLLGSPSKLPLADPDITVRFEEDLRVRKMSFLGADEYGLTDQGFFLLDKGTRQAKARIPFDRIGGPCEIVCKRRAGSVPLLMPIVSLSVLKKQYVSVHASAVVYNNLGLLMAGWAHCGKTAALLGFASEGAEYVGEEWVLLNACGQRMHGLVRPLEVSRWHVATLPQMQNVVNLRNRCAFYGIGVLDRLRKIISTERIQSSLVLRNLEKVSAAVGERLRRPVAPSAIFKNRICSSGAQVDKVFLFVCHEDCSIEAMPIAPFEMAWRLTSLVQAELTPLLRSYAAYRFSFPGQRNDLIENAAEYAFGTLTRVLDGKDTYIVRLPYPCLFSELYKTIQPFCRPTVSATAQSEHA